MSELNRITVDANQCGGRPCLRGLRIRVKDALALLAARTRHEESLGDRHSGGSGAGGAHGHGALVS